MISRAFESTEDHFATHARWVELDEEQAERELLEERLDRRGDVAGTTAAARNRYRPLSPARQPSRATAACSDHARGKDAPPPGAPDSATSPVLSGEPASGGSPRVERGDRQ